jgi:mono/diheme cytochrome c family protein
VGPRTALLLAALASAALLTVSGLGVASGASVPGNPARGKALFLRPGLFCGSCHTLKAAKSRGRDGPNLDRVKESYSQLVEVITKGRNPTRRWPTGMPGYAKAGELTKAEIRDLAAFVYTATHR